MRLKAAEVLVEMEGTIAPLNAHDSVRARRAQEIYSSHEALWMVSIYGHRDVADDPGRTLALLAQLQADLGLALQDSAGNAVPTPSELVVRSIASVASIPRDRETELQKAIDRRLSARTAFTFEERARVGLDAIREEFSEISLPRRLKEFPWSTFLKPQAATR